MSEGKIVKVSLRLNKSDYEYLRKMAESKFDYGGLNLIIRNIIHTFVINTKQLEQKHKAVATEDESQNSLSPIVEAAE